MSHKESFCAKIWIENSLDCARIIYVEPWGEDYTLLPQQKLEIVARSASELPYFHLFEYKDSTQVYLERTDDFDVLQDGFRVACGHQRQATLDAGLEM